MSEVRNPNVGSWGYSTGSDGTAAYFEVADETYLYVTPGLMRIARGNESEVASVLTDAQVTALCNALKGAE